MKTGSKTQSLFKGLSTLRKDEAKAAPPKPVNAALQSYLQKYTDGGASSEGVAKKKRKKVKPQQGSALAIVDEDLTGFGSVRAAAAEYEPTGDEEEDDEDADGPVIVNAEEAEALKKQLHQAKNFYGLKEDGRGWVVEDNNEQRGPGHPSTSGRGLPAASHRAGSTAAATARHARSEISDDAQRDASPPRRGARRHDLPDTSPPRRGSRHDSPPDVSPPRRGGGVRHDSPDASPPRRGARKYSPSPATSPPRRSVTRHDSPPDASPPRRHARNASPSPAASPPRRSGARHDSPPDASPPRRNGTRHDSPPDASPPRRGVARHDSPPHHPSSRTTAAAPTDVAAGAHRAKRQRHDSPEDSSPPRRPSEQQQQQQQLQQPKHSRGREGGAGGIPRMTDGTVSGLVNSQQLMEEGQSLRREAEERRRGAEGRGSGTTYRDKATGKIVSAEEVQATKAEAKRLEREAKNPYDANQHLEWRGGLAQKHAKEAAVKEMQELAEQPFARSQLDASVDEKMKGQVRWGDPMGHLVKGPKAEAPPPQALTERYGNDSLKSSGFKIPQEVPAHSWQKRGAPAPINRYGIRPGRHWDGVDRSTGFEKEMFLHQNARAALEVEARQWSQADM